MKASRPRPLSSALLGALSALLFIATAAAGARAESFELDRVGRVFIDDVVAAPNEERVVDLYMRVETSLGDPLDRIGASDLVIRDNGEIIDQQEVVVQRLSEARAGISAVLVIDTTRSMRGEPFEKAREAALAFLDRTGEFDHVAVVSFDDDVTVVSDFGAPRTQLRVALEELEVRPKTLSKVVWDGALKAIELLRARDSTLPRRAFVILFSDGRDSGSVVDLEEVLHAAEGDRETARVPIFTIGYSAFGGSGFEDLDRLAHGTTASAFQASDPAELGRFYDDIWRRMSASLVVRFPGDMDGQMHAIGVEVEGRSDDRSAAYPEISGPIWPWFLGAAVLLAVGGGVYLFTQNRSPGRLVYEGGARSGQAESLRAGRTRVGGLDENDIVLNFPTVSRYHAALHASGGELEVEDLGSKNGTFLNGTPVRGRAAVKAGDKLRFGDVDMIFRP